MTHQAASVRWCQVAVVAIWKHAERLPANSPELARLLAEAEAHGRSPTDARTEA